MRGFQGGDDFGRGAQRDARLADRLMHGFAQGCFDIAGGQRGERGGRDLLGGGEGQLGGFLRAPLRFRLALVQRRAQRRSTSAAMVWFDVLGGARPGRPSVPSLAGAGATSSRSPRWCRVFFWRARAAWETTSPSARNSVSKVNLWPWLINTPARLRRCRWRS